MQGKSIRGQKTRSKTAYLLGISSNIGNNYTIYDIYLRTKNDRKNKIVGNHI